MSQSETPAKETPVKTGIPLKWGILTGFIAILLTTVNYTFLLSNYAVFIGFNFVIFGVTLVLYGIAGIQQRKALGGYITLREAFSAIFVVILISSLFSTIYGVLYVKVIDVHAIEKVKEGTVAFLERVNAPEEKIDEAVTAFETEAAESTKPARLLFSFAKQLVIQSIFGFICALIVRRKRPVFPEQS